LTKNQQHTGIVKNPTIDPALTASGRYRVSARVLIVDGSTVARRLISEALQRKASMVEIITCNNGREALAELAKTRFDLVTTALLLPDMDGLMLCRAIRDNPPSRHTPVVVVSGDADTRLLREGFSAGVTDYFDKSRGFPDLVRFISDFLERASGISERILLVEDSAAVAKVLSRMMDRHGFEATLVTSAEEALTLLTPPAGSDENAPANNFALVLTDFHLKGVMTGGDLLHAIRTRLKLNPQELPVLVMTGNDSIEQQVEVFHAGANDYVTKPAVEEILIARLRALLLIRQQFATLQRQKAQMEILSLTDGLTGVYNRRYLLEQGAGIYKEEENLPMSAIILDIDHFKKINDTRGHLKGDIVLKNVGKAILRALPHYAVVIRYGGEEFCVLLPHHTDKEALEQADVIRAWVEQMNPEGIPVTISAGVATGTPDKLNLESLLKRADDALYIAKQEGRNCVRLSKSA